MIKLKYIIIIFIGISFKSIAQIDSLEYYISGTVELKYRNSKIELANKTVMLLKHNKSVKTDVSGNFVFKKLSYGKYDIQIYDLPRTFILKNILTQNTSIKNNSIIIKAKNDWASREIAIIDIKKKKIRLLIAGGVAPIYYENQHRFERKFKIKYYDYGDLLSVPFRFINEYNQEVFKYLDSKYGDKWRKNVRKDVYGL